MYSSDLFKLSFLVVKCFKNLDDEKKSLTSSPFFLVPQARGCFRLLATFVSVQDVAADCSQPQKSKVSFLLAESLRRLVSELVGELCTVSLEMDTKRFEGLSS